MVTSIKTKDNGVVLLHPRSLHTTLLQLSRPIISCSQQGILDFPPHNILISGKKDAAQLKHHLLADCLSHRCLTYLFIF